MANLGGNGGMDWGQAYMANGQAFTEDPRLAAQLGGHGELAFLTDYIKRTGGKGLDPALLAEFTNSAGIKYLANGMAEIGNGITKYWSDLVADAAKAISEISGNITDAFGAAAQSITDQAQAITSGVSAMGNQLAGNVASNSALSALQTALNGNGGDLNVNVQVTHHGDIVVGENGSSDLTDIHGNALDRAFIARRYSLANASVAT
jgi:hypothetical protein